MTENLYYIELFDIYGNLLTERQQNYFRDYFFENLLLDEISENECVSKSAISKHILEAKKKLEYYERILGLKQLRDGIKEEFATEKDILKRLTKYDIIDNIRRRS